MLFPLLKLRTPISQLGMNLSVCLLLVPILPSHLSTSNLLKNGVSDSSTSMSNSANQLESYWRNYIYIYILFTQRMVETINLTAMQEMGEFFIISQVLTLFFFPKHLYNTH